jgi:hypothetical protein
VSEGHDVSDVSGLSPPDEAEQPAEEERSPVDQALDVFFFAPIGLALNRDEMIGRMAERGRQSVTAARMLGQLAMHQGRFELDKVLDRVQDHAATFVERFGYLGRDVRPTTDEATPPPPPVDPVVVDPGTGPVEDEPAPVVTAGEVNLAIPDYDSLAASQVVPRLAGLTPSELETVRRYEAAHRGRTTILHRVAQLQRATF